VNALLTLLVVLLLGGLTPSDRIDRDALYPEICGTSAVDSHGFNATFVEARAPGRLLVAPVSDDPAPEAPRSLILAGIADCGTPAECEGFVRHIWESIPPGEVLHVSIVGRQEWAGEAIDAVVNAPSLGSESLNHRLLRTGAVSYDVGTAAGLDDVTNCELREAERRARLDHVGVWGAG